MSGQAFFQPINGSAFAHLGPAAATAMDPRAPLDETADADRQLLKCYGSDPAAVLGGKEVMGMLAEFAEEMRVKAQARPMLKALRYSNPSSSDPKAHDEAVLQRIGGGEGGKYAPKPGLPFQGLRWIGRRIEIVQAIMRQRQRQVLAFCEPAKLDSEPGWMLGPADQDAVLGDDHTQFLGWLQNFIQCGSRRFDPLSRRINKNEDFRTFLSKMVADSLLLDHAAIETVPLRGALGIDSFFMRDSATFYFATGEMSERQGIYAYQDLTMAQQVEFKHEELYVMQRNPMTDLEWSGYAYGELEAGLDTISTVLSAFAYTREALDNNAIPRGLLMISGSFDNEAWQRLEQAWQVKMRGAANAHGLPVMRSMGQQGDAKYIQTGAPVSEMAFAKWISLQVAILTSLYGMDPAEIGMESFSAEKSTLSGNDTGEKLASSKDKGLRPLLRDVASCISDNVLARFTTSPWVRFRFTGIRSQDEQKASEERVRMMTVDEVRAKHGMKPHPQAWIGALPADSGMQSAEFQRLNTVATVGEGRAAWGGLPEYPDEIVNSAPLNPSLQAVYNQALQGKAGDAQADTIGQDGKFSDQPDAPKPPPEDGLGGETLDRLRGLQPGREEEPEPSEEGPGAD